MNIQPQENKCSDLVQDLIDVQVVPKTPHNEAYFHPYLDYQTEWRPKYASDVNYANMFMKMCQIHGYLNEKLKDEVLMKSLLQDTLKTKQPVKGKLLETKILKTRRIRRKKNEIVCFYHVPPFNPFSKKNQCENPDCSKKYGTLDALTLHIRRKHPELLNKHYLVFFL